MRTLDHKDSKILEFCLYDPQTAKTFKKLDQFYSGNESESQKYSPWPLDQASFHQHHLRKLLLKDGHLHLRQGRSSLPQQYLQVKHNIYYCVSYSHMVITSDAGAGLMDCKYRELQT